MKKIFTMAMAAFAAATSWAAVPELLFQGQPVEPGVTYETGYTTEEFDLGDFILISYVQDTHLTLRGTIGESVTVKVKASQAVQVCSLDGFCIADTEVTKVGVIANEVEDLRIDKLTDDYTGTASPSEILSDITVEVEAYYTSTPDQSVSTKVILRNVPESQLGIAGVNTDNQQIWFFGNTLNYSVEQPTKLELYNVNGALVMSRVIASEGSISMDSLHPGIYIYRAGSKAGKALIRK